MQEDVSEMMHELNTPNRAVTPTPKFSNGKQPRSNSAVPTNKENGSKGATAGNLLPRIKLGKNKTSSYNSNNGTSGSQTYKAYVWGSGKDGRCGNGKESSEKMPSTIKSQYKFA